MKKKDKIIVSILVILVAVLFIGGQIKHNREEFTKEKWENYAGNSRQTILTDFVDRTKVGGMTKAEVKELLGEADEETETFLNYYLGMPRGLFGTKMEGEEEYLLFRFEDGTVTKLEKLTQSQLPKESTYRPILPEAEDGTLYPTGSKGGEA